MKQEEDGADAPVHWRNPEPPKRVVPPSQFHEFERAYSKLERQIADLTLDYEYLKGQYDKLRQTSQELANEKQTLDRSRRSLTTESEVIDARLKTENPSRRTTKSDQLTRTEIMEIQSTTKLIREIALKKAALEHELTEEQGLWKTERKRMVQLLEAAKEKNTVMKQSIEQFRTYLEEKKDSFVAHVQVEVNPNIRRNEPMSPVSQKQPQSPPQCLLPAPTESSSEGASFDDNEALFSSPIRERPQPRIELKPKLPVVPRFEQKIPPAQPNAPESRFNFDYWPDDEGSVSRDGREIYFENGDTIINCKGDVRKLRHGTMELIRFGNGDVEVRLADGSVGYRFSETQAIELTLPDSTRHCIFANGQREIFFANGDKFLVTSKWTRYTRANGDYQVRGVDGDVMTCVNGVISRT
jgi:hypothetical protein